LEMYERNVSRVRNDFREFSSALEFRSIVTNLICNLRRLPPLPRFLVSIDWYSCPYRLDLDVAFRPGTEDPRYVLSALRELGYLDIEDASPNSTTVLIRRGQKLVELTQAQSSNSRVVIGIPEDLPNAGHRRINEGVNGGSGSASITTEVDGWG